MSRRLGDAPPRGASAPDRRAWQGQGDRAGNRPNGTGPGTWHRDLSLRDEAGAGARGERRLADGGGAGEPGRPALEPEREAAVRRHPVSERLQVAVVGLDVPVEGGDVVVVAVEAL